MRDGLEGPDKLLVDPETPDGAKAYFSSRGGTDCWFNGKKMDPASVQDFISRQLDLTTSKLVESRSANPSIEVTVTSDNGKRVEG